MLWAPITGALITDHCLTGEHRSLVLWSKITGPLRNGVLSTDRWCSEHRCFEHRSLVLWSPITASLVSTDHWCFVCRWWSGLIYAVFWSSKTILFNDLIFNQKCPSSVEARALALQRCSTTWTFQIEKKIINSLKLLQCKLFLYVLDIFKMTFPAMTWLQKFFIYCRSTNNQQNQYLSAAKNTAPMSVYVHALTFNIVTRK